MSTLLFVAYLALSVFAAPLPLRRRNVGQESETLSRQVLTAIIVALCVFNSPDSGRAFADCLFLPVICIPAVSAFIWVSCKDSCRRASLATRKRPHHRPTLSTGDGLQRTSSQSGSGLWLNPNGNVSNATLPLYEIGVRPPGYPPPPPDYAVLPSPPPAHIIDS
ncbi:hypothetical protein GYMLUDRAFT_236335 [Collybiopsis luxurians FD-317 M1]|nr:hypothetical protein GYMLUDRAFT_236335 [Collybiopsis luxurians FD-317 M1]